MPGEMTMREAAEHTGVSRQRMNVLVLAGRVKVTRRFTRFTLLDAASVRSLKAELDSEPHSKFRRKKN